MMIAMFIIGLGLGQLMQTLIMASQNSVAPQDMGVATASSTFFRQIGGTLGTAVLLSVLFSVMPGNIQTAMGNRADLDAALNAALNPTVASKAANKPIMDQLWNKIVTPVKSQVQSSLDKATTQVTDGVRTAVTKQVTAAVQQQVAAGAVPEAAAQSVIDQQVQAALPAATDTALKQAATKANATVVNGKLTVDYADASQRKAVVDEVGPAIAKKIKQGAASSGTTTSTSDTSFLNGADKALSKPFLKGFNASAIEIYWVGMIVILIAFVLTWFFRVPPLRKVSALQERADAAAAQEELELEANHAAQLAGSPVAPSVSTGQISLTGEGPA
jgi:hypothetical protein